MVASVCRCAVSEGTFVVLAKHLEKKTNHNGYFSGGVDSFSSFL